MKKNRGPILQNDYHKTDYWIGHKIMQIGPGLLLKISLNQLPIFKQGPF